MTCAGNATADPHPAYQTAVNDYTQEGRHERPASHTPHPPAVHQLAVADYAAANPPDKKRH